MIYVPEKYQTRALKFALLNKTCGLLMRMGTGKTSVVLTLIDLLMYQTALINRVLLIAPIRVAAMTWPDEIAKWDHTKHLSYVCLHGKEKDALVQDCKETDIVAVNFEGIQWLVRNRKYLAMFDMLVVDESTWLKNPTGVRSKLVHDLSRFIPRRIILTGSPSPNSVQDLWSQMFILDRGDSLGPNITAFRKDYMVRAFSGYGYEARPDAKKMIVRSIANKVIVIEDKDLKGMPDVVQNIVRIRLSAKAMKVYKTMEKEALLELEGLSIEALSASAKIQKLRQIVSGFVYGKTTTEVVKIHNERCKTLKELITSLNRNVLVAVQFKEEVKIIQDYFKKDIPFINSTTNKADATKYLRQWEAGKLPILMAHPKSIGHGLNLQSGGCDIIWFSLTWSLEEWEQYIARLARKGQLSSKVFNHILLAIGTVDNPVFEALNTKDATQRGILKALKEWRIG